MTACGEKNIFFFISIATVRIFESLKGSGMINRKISLGLWFRVVVIEGLQNCIGCLCNVLL